MNGTDIIQEEYQRLLAALPKCMTQQDRSIVEAAFRLALEAHASQKRKSGLPYIMHPLAVARILVEEMYQESTAVIAAALLHDVVEDTKVSIGEIQAQFGETVAFLVGAVTKPADNHGQVENFQHILSSVKGDIRVLLVKLADRLHNMRTLDSLPLEKKWRIASETEFLFAPLAGRLGLYKVKSQLENLAFQFLNPKEYNHISALLEEDRRRTEQSVTRFMEDCLRTIGSEIGGPIGFGIRYRSPFSVWRDMNELHCDFYHVPFKHYIRVCFDRFEVDDALNYLSPQWLTDEEIILRIYSILSQHYREQTGSFVNYVSQPKSNGYQAVHCRFLNPYGGIEEFHIASNEMRFRAEYGCIDSEEEWLGRLTDILNELANDPESLMPGIRDSLYNEDIVAFTPRGMAISLPKSATALDFAYAVHSAIGDHACYARINGRLASFRTPLKRGDCVEIGTDDSAHPEPDWMNAVTTYKAKKCIRAWMNKLPKPAYALCPHCHPMPGSEIIGFRDSDGRVTLHSRGCPEAICIASEKGRTIIDVTDFVPVPNVLYPVRLCITAIDRYHLLGDILDVIVEDSHLSMSSLSTHTEDHIVTGLICFSVHSAIELEDVVAKVRSIRGVEEVNAD